MPRSPTPQPTSPDTLDEHGVYRGFPELAIDGYEFGEFLDRMKPLVARNIGSRLAQLRRGKHPAATDLEATHDRFNDEFPNSIMAWAKSVAAIEQFELNLRSVESSP